MIATDAGPLVALVDRRDEDHDLCVTAISELEGPMMTTWPALTEAMYLLARLGLRGQEVLWSMVHHGLEIVDSAVHREDRVRELMKKYNDVPMSVADASMVAMCESLGTWRIFTLDSDFLVYRGLGRHRFEVIPRILSD